jgi:hypothetical protein
MRAIPHAARVAKLACVVAAGLTAAGCGASVAGSSGGAPAPPGSSTPAPAPVPPSQALVGAGAAFAPPGSVFYMSSPEVGPAWAQLTALRGALPGRYTQLGSGSAASVGVLAGALIAPINGAHGFGRECAMILESTTLAKDNGPDLLFYQPVQNRAAAENWVLSQPHMTRARPQGAYAIYAATTPGAGAWAISNRVSLWASTKQRLQEAMDRAASHGPSLAGDPGFRSAMSRVDAKGAAIVGFSRANLFRELATASYAGNHFGGAAPLAQRFGFLNMGFTVGATRSGIVFRAFPSDGVYQPGRPFHPLLPAVMPATTMGFADTSDAAALFPAAQAVLRVLGTREQPDQHIERVAGISASQLAVLLRGEQAIWFGPSDEGFGTRADDPDAAEAALRTAAAFQHLGGGFAITTHRLGSMVWATQETTVPAGSLLSRLNPLEAHAGIPDRVSLLAYLNSDIFSGVDAAETRDTKPIHTLLWTLPRPSGWEFDIYLEPTKR